MPINWIDEWGEDIQPTDSVVSAEAGANVVNILDEWSVDPLQVGREVFFSFTESKWNKPFPVKRHHDIGDYDSRRVILKGRVTDVEGGEFKALLGGNNGFEKDGQEFVFSKGNLLANQDYSDTSNLGVWQDV